MRIDDFGDFIAYICVPLATILNCWFVLPRLSGHSRIYYIFLMAWAVPYVIGNFCDSNKIGPRWVQWYLLDISFESWGTTFWVAMTVAVMAVIRRVVTQRFILICSVVSFLANLVLAFGYEVAQSWLAWSRFGPTIDWLDHCSYVIGTVIAIIPFLAFRQLRPMNAQIS